MKLQGPKHWNLTYENNRVVLMTQESQFQPLESFLNLLPEDEALRMAELAKKNIGYSFNGFGTSFQGDFDEHEKAIDYHEVMISSDINQKDIIMNKNIFLRILSAYVFMWQNVSDNPNKFSKVVEGLSIYDVKEPRLSQLQFWGVRNTGIQRKLLFGGPENKLKSFKEKIQIKNEISFEIKYHNVRWQRIENLPNEIAKPFCDVIHSGIFENKETVDGHFFPIRFNDIFYHHVNIEHWHYIIMTTFFEKQPGLYMFILEGIWELDAR